jgi:four helix bundle protein
MKVRNYQDLIVWQKSMDLVQQIYEVTRHFPAEEKFALTNQMRRAAVSVPSNIAEGQGRRTTPDFLKHLSIAYGSLRELETQTMIADRLRFLAKTECQDILDSTGEIGRLLNGLRNSLKY